MQSSRSKAGSVSSSEEGSAVVEFTFLALLLMVPVVYFIVTVGQIQGGSFAAVGAADQAAKAYAMRQDSKSATAAAEQAVLLALSDHGHSIDQAKLSISCDRDDCLSPGTAVSATVELRIPLPLFPFAERLSMDAANVSATATHVVARFQ